MARPNLIPTTIVDRNGKTTTVHKKTHRGSTIPTIPSPMTKDVRVKRAATAQLLARRVNELLELPVYGAPDQKKLLNMLGKTYSMRFTNELESLFAEDTDEAKGVASQIMKGKSEYQIGETRHFYRVMPERGYNTVLPLVESLRYYHGRKKIDDLRNTKPAINQQNIALIKVTDALNKLSKKTMIQKAPDMYIVMGRSQQPAHNDTLTFVTLDINQNPVMKIRNEDLYALVLERADDADEIVKIIEEYELTTAQPIRGILEGIIPSLADGML